MSAFNNAIADAVIFLFSEAGGAVPATIKGQEIWVIPSLLEDEVVFSSGDIHRISPFVEALESVVLAIAPEAGNNGDILTVFNKDYTVLSIKPRIDGVVVLELEGL